MTKKLRVLPMAIKSAEALEAAVAQYVRLKLEKAEKEIKIEQEKAEIDAKHQSALVEMNDAIEAVEIAAEVYCERHPEIFGEAKSIDLVLAKIGYRTNPPKVEKNRGKEKWELIAARLLSTDWGEKYIRYPDPEVNKEALIADRAVLTEDQLEDAGVSVVQEETFFIEPKTTAVQGLSKEAA
jgi:phage host-nuclease inhibitor protein Gam